MVVYYGALSAGLALLLIAAPVVSAVEPSESHKQGESHTFSDSKKLNEGKQSLGTSQLRDTREVRSEAPHQTITAAAIHSRWQAVGRSDVATARQNCAAPFFTRAVSLTYAVKSRSELGEINGRSVLTWQPLRQTSASSTGAADHATYRSTLSIRALLIDLLISESTGQISALPQSEFQPKTYREKVILRDEQVLTFDQSTQKIQHTANRKTVANYPLRDGEQDNISLIWQLRACAMRQQIDLSDAEKSTTKSIDKSIAKATQKSEKNAAPNTEQAGGKKLEIYLPMTGPIDIYNLRFVLLGLEAIPLVKAEWIKKWQDLFEQNSTQSDRVDRATSSQAALAVKNNSIDRDQYKLAWHWQRLPEVNPKNAADSKQFDFWFAPALGFLPVRIRHSEPDQKFLDLVLIDWSVADK